MCRCACAVCLPLTLTEGRGQFPGAELRLQGMKVQDKAPCNGTLAGG